MYVGPLEAGDDPRCIIEAGHQRRRARGAAFGIQRERARIVRRSAWTRAIADASPTGSSGHIGSPYDFAHAWAWPLVTQAACAADDGAGREALHLLEPARAGVPLHRPLHRQGEARCVVPRDFESAAGFQVPMVPLG